MAVVNLFAVSAVHAGSGSAFRGRLPDKRRPYAAAADIPQDSLLVGVHAACHQIDRIGLEGGNDLDELGKIFLGPLDHCRILYRIDIEASGFIGSAITKELLKAGHQVLGLARSDASAKAIAAAGAEVHRGSLDDLTSLQRGHSCVGWGHPYGIY
jgi:hypothetical protein